jgi:hypothetical protein
MENRFRRRGRRHRDHRHAGPPTGRVGLPVLPSYFTPVRVRVRGEVQPGWQARKLSRAGLQVAWSRGWIAEARPAGAQDPRAQGALQRTPRGVDNPGLRWRDCDRPPFGEPLEPLLALRSGAADAPVLPLSQADRSETFIKTVSKVRYVQVHVALCNDPVHATALDWMRCSRHLQTVSVFCSFRQYVPGSTIV